MFSLKKKNFSKHSKITFGVFFLPNYDFKFIKQNKTYFNNLNNLIKTSFQLNIIPVGGLNRYFWSFTSERNLPNIDVSDCHLPIEYWQNYTCCKISSFIDLDSLEAKEASASFIELEKELEHACYLDVSYIAIKLQRKSSPKLATFLNNWLKNRFIRFKIWIIVPTNACALIGANDLDDVWQIWTEFRRLCNNSKKIGLALKICSDCNEEFFDLYLRNRWIGEPLECLWIEDSLYTSLQNCILNYDYKNQNSCIPSLSSFHNNLISFFLNFINYIIFVTENLSDLSIKKKHIINLIDETPSLFDSIPNEALNVLQIPLQPLSQNLTSTIYQTFELDNIKYKKYSEAIESAIIEILTRRSLLSEKLATIQSINIFILGAGRGPLVDILFKVEKKLNLKFKTNFVLKKWAVEKNPGAFTTLKFKNENLWNNTVELIHCDMRDLATFFIKKEKLELIVSELLGSFGDNELSPECLDGLNDMIDESTICIPKYYCNYIAPIYSAVFQQQIDEMKKIHQNQQATGRNLKYDEVIVTDCSYVVCMKNYSILADSLLCFEFFHPNRKKKSNKRHSTLSFEIKKNTEITGFVGYFEACLYENIFISIKPETHTLGMFSWFPIFFPLRKPIQCNQLMQIIFDIKRKVDKNGIWYEWKIDYNAQNDQDISLTQNLNGLSQYFFLK